MALPHSITDRLDIPLMAAPMFLASNPALVIQCCMNGVIGSFPAKNQRSLDGLDSWLEEISLALETARPQTRKPPAPYAVNLIVHKSNSVIEDELALLEKYKVPIVVTSLGAVSDVVDTVHGWGGLVYHDIISLRHAQKAAQAGVDGLICVAAGAGGHTGAASPFGLVNEVKQFFEGTVILSGALSTGRDIAAAQMMGADLAYMGTRFIATQECASPPAYKQMVMDSALGDIVTTDKVTGVTASFMAESLASYTPDHAEHEMVDINKELADALDQKNNEKKPWRDVWSAGHGVGSVDTMPLTADLIAQLKSDYLQALAEISDAASPYIANT